ncbi:hypothetical protein Z043_120180, partial [Scleropages formosus]
MKVILSSRLEVMRTPSYFSSHRGKDCGEWGNGITEMDFSFPPLRRLPSSFTGEHGSIQYKVEAKLSRSWRIPSRAMSPFMFLSKVDLSTHQLMLPQQGIITKTFKVFTSGNVTFKPYDLCCQVPLRLVTTPLGTSETVKVRVEVSNGTSREITPKFCVTQKQNFFASGKRKLHKNTVLKAAGEPVPAKSEQTHVRMVSLPHDLSVSILNCDILKVEYKIRVYLDIPYAINPELKMPIVILPASYVSHSAAKTKQPGPVRAISNISCSTGTPTLLGFRGSTGPIDPVYRQSSRISAGGSNRHPPMMAWPGRENVKSISISYDPINEQNTFSNGDVLTGWVVVVITKKTKIETLLVKVRGKAEVFWSESHGENTDYYHAKEKCLKLDQIILSRKKDESESLPSTFKGAHGSIQYKVEAKLSRSWRVPSRAKSPFTFQSKVDLCVQQLMVRALYSVHTRSPQHETIRKKYNFLTSGIVNMNVNLDKSSYRQGDGLKVTVEVDNGTSREIAPKFCVTQKQNFYANGRRNLYMKKVVKAVGKPIPGKSQQMLVQVLDLPRDLSVSILNCKILKVEYKLRVYLNIPYAKDPELKIPFVVLPADYVFLPAAEPDLSVPFSTFGDTGKTNPPPAVPVSNINCPGGTSTLLGF